MPFLFKKSYFRGLMCYRMRRVVAFLKEKYSLVYIWVLVPVIVIASFSHHRWVNPEKVIEWDVKSYYAYLPAFFIEKDMSLEFMKKDPEKYWKWIWPVETATGKKCIVTTMGLSMLYSPFFLIAHGVASVTDYSSDGYSEPYAFALHFSAMFYVLFGLFFLRKFLLKYFRQPTVLITLIVVFIGTNLFYYTAYIAAMSHSYNFALISIFLYFTDKWYEKPGYKRTIIIGIVFGLITLIRPTNIVVLLVFIFFGVFKPSEIKERIALLLRNYKKILVMLLFYLLIWIPQFAYWKYVSGKFFYFSYGDLGASFYWKNPQLFDILLSYRKGWWVYTPVMFIAVLGVFLLLKQHRDKFLAVSLFLIVNIYVQASWWCWWFGGSFGLRAFVDSYGILAIPLAVVVERSIKARWKGYAVILVLGVLTWYNTFQIKQMIHQTLHYWWMSRTAYWMNFLEATPSQGYWETVPVPDYEKARKGVYVAKNLIIRYKPYQGITVEPEEIVKNIKKELKTTRQIKNMSENYNISVDSALEIEAWNTYERKRSIARYVRPLVAEKIVDSLMNDTSYLHNTGELLEMEERRRREHLMGQTLDRLKKERFK